MNNEWRRIIINYPVKSKFSFFGRLTSRKYIQLSGLSNNDLEDNLPGTTVLSHDDNDN